jgi:hypothetical protein
MKKFLVFFSFQITFVMGCVAQSIVSTEPFSEGLAKAREDWGYTPWGYINEKGKWAIPPRFKACTHFSENRAAFQEGDLWGFIDKSGKVVVKPIFREVKDFSEGVAAVQDTHFDWGYIDLMGKWIMQPSFHSATSFKKNCAMVGVLTKENTSGVALGYIKKDSTWWIEPKFMFANEFYNNWAFVKYDYQTWGWISYSGALVFTHNYTLDYYEPPHISEGIVHFRDKVSGKHGFIDTTGKILIAAQFIETKPFYKSTALVMIQEKSDKKWILIDKSGKILFSRPNTTVIVEDWDKDFLRAFDWDKRLYVLINRKGEQVLPSQFSGLGEMKEGKMAARDTTIGTVGYMNLKGKWVIPPMKPIPKVKMIEDDGR